MLSQKKRKGLYWGGMLLLFILSLGFITFVFATDNGVDPQETQPFASTSAQAKQPAQLINLLYDTSGHASFDMNGYGKAVVQVPFFTNSCYASRAYFSTQTYTCQNSGRLATFKASNLESGMAVDFESQPGIVSIRLVGGNDGMPWSQVPHIDITWG
ncbi:MAG TPA: hypothetical protein VNG90_01585 [Candidatus Acidoferrum sp.]|nr:hypothetical protein [Candidatus Acidoferrum sp.]